MQRELQNHGSLAAMEGLVVVSMTHNQFLMHAHMESEADAPGKVEQADLSIVDRVNALDLQTEIGQQLNGRCACIIVWSDADGRCKV